MVLQITILEEMSEKCAALLYVCRQAELYRPDMLFTYEQVHRMIVVDYRLLSAAFYQKLVPITEDTLIHSWNINRTGAIPARVFGDVPKKDIQLRDYFVHSEWVFDDLNPGINEIEHLEKRGYVRMDSVTSPCDAQRSFSITATKRAKGVMPLEQVLELDCGYIEDVAVRARVIKNLKTKLGLVRC